jgi:hypothetical protein
MYNKTAGTFGTAVLSPVFTLFQESTGKDSDFVAGAGIAPAPEGYEPSEVLLLHPAMNCVPYSFNRRREYRLKSLPMHSLPETASTPNPAMNCVPLITIHKIMAYILAIRKNTR